jgi:hypothetical protein
MTLRPLAVRCPTCGAAEVTYTGEPSCCFNHICGACYTTFQLATERRDGELRDAEPPPSQRDGLAPTVACARCGSLDVFMVDAAGAPPSHLGCAACRASLTLVYCDIESR